MEGTAKRQVNAEDMLAELKRVVESSTRAPPAPPPSASTTPKPGSPRRETRRSHWGIDPPDNANGDKSIGPRTDLQKRARPISRSWKPIAGGVGLAVAATIGVSFALINKAPDSPARALPAAATAGLAGQQSEPALKPSSASPSMVGVARHAEATGALEAPPHASEASANSAPIPVPEKAVLGAPNLASFGLNSAPAFTPVPPSSPAIPVPTQRIGPDGAPIAPASPASTASVAPLAQAPKTAAPGTGSPTIGPDAAPAAAATQSPATTASATPPAEEPKTASPAVGTQAVKPNGPPVATPPPRPPSADSASPTEAPKPSATRTASAPDESAEPSTPKAESRRKPPERPSAQKPRRSAKASAKLAAQERQSAKPAQAKEAAPSPPPAAQGAAATPLAAPAPKASVQQRLADGVTHAFGYLVHLPGALVPHLGGSNADAH
jgi:hypothetical protein